MRCGRICSAGWITNRAEYAAVRSYPPIITQSQQPLVRMDKLPPGWNIDFSRQLLEQAQVLWPEQANPLIQQWQQQLNAAALPAEHVNGWHEGMTQLQALADKMNALGGQKGKYITVSELK